MRYFFISDVHGCYDKMIAALEQSGFDMEKDTLVNLGDPFDRGTQSKEVLDYMLSCPHHIFIIGNHDWRLKELMVNPVSFTKYDIMNGICDTVRSFLKLDDGPIPSMWDGLKGLCKIEALYRYFGECNYAIEFKDLIGVHTWVPTIQTHKGQYMEFHDYNLDGSFNLDTTWRDSLSIDWYDAVWGHTENLMKSGIFPEKKMIIGHWHSWRLAEAFSPEKRVAKKLPGEQYEYIDCSIYEDEHIIAIDGCVNWPNGGKVNVYIYETNEAPMLYPISFRQ